MEIRVEGIRKKYRKKTVLERIDFTGASGQCIGIAGANGCGKSTLFSILAGVNKADSGAFLCDGVNLLADMKKRAEIVGYVPQGTPLIEELNAYDNLLLWYEKERLAEELEKGFLCVLEIGEFLKVPVGKMSGGMKKRLSIGCAVAHNPKILLLDEPSAALDLVCKESISNYLNEYKKQGGIILLASHDLQELKDCDCVYVMKNGVLSPCKVNGDIHDLVGKL